MRGAAIPPVWGCASGATALSIAYPASVSRRFPPLGGVEESTRAVIADWVSIASLLGFGLAIAQLHRTRRAVDAANSAIGRTQRQLAVHQALLIIPQLQKLEGDIDLAVVSESREVAIRHLAEWRRLASDVCGLVNGRVSDEGVRTIQQSAVAAGEAKSLLLSPSNDLLDNTDHARSRIAGACEVLGALAGELKAYSIDGEPDERL